MFLPDGVPAPDNLTTTTYNGAGKVILTTDASGGRTEKQYNERGLLTREATKIEEGSSPSKTTYTMTWEGRPRPIVATMRPQSP